MLQSEYTMAKQVCWSSDWNLQHQHGTRWHAAWNSSAALLSDSTSSLDVEDGTWYCIHNNSKNHRTTAPQRTHSVAPFCPNTNQHWKSLQHSTVQYSTAQHREVKLENFFLTTKECLMALSNNIQAGKWCLLIDAHSTNLHKSNSEWRHDKTQKVLNSSTRHMTIAQAHSPARLLRTST
jgi:hypothetical protein